MNEKEEDALKNKYRVELLEDENQRIRDMRLVDRFQDILDNKFGKNVWKVFYIRNTKTE